MRRVDVDKTNQVIQRLSEISSEGIPIIVEGKRDRQALRQLGIEGKILTITKPLEEIAEEISSEHREAIILTDYDSRGKILAGKLRDLLMNEGVSPNLEFRFELRRYTGLEFIEELPSLLLKAGETKE